MLFKYSDFGRPLSAEEVDSNWTDIEEAISELQTLGIRISQVRATADGGGIEFVATDGTVLGDVGFPAPLEILGDWETGAAYTGRSMVVHDGLGFLCAIPHEATDFAVDLADGKWIPLGSGATTAEDVSYDPVVSGNAFTATTVQGAIDELASALRMTQTVISDLENELELRLVAIEGRLDALESA